MNNNRIVIIDYMRAFCILLIILAHVNPPYPLFLFRSFDVVGLVFLSVICIRPITSKDDYFVFLKNRFTRLLIPTYFTIALILLSTFFFCKLYRISYIYSLKDILGTFLLIDGFGYVWIIRILLIISILHPFSVMISKLRLDFLIPSSIFLLFLDRLLLDFLSNNFFFYYIILYNMGYICIAVWSLRLKEIILSNNSNCNLVLVLLFIVLFFYKIGEVFFFDSSFFSLIKHPPMLDWISYGFIMSILLFKTIVKYKPYIDEYIPLRNFLCWISFNSMLIYYVHVILIKHMELYKVINGHNIVNEWYNKYIILIILSFLLSYLFKRVMGRLSRLISI